MVNIITRFIFSLFISYVRLVTLSHFPYPCGTLDSYLMVALQYLGSCIILSMVVFLYLKMFLFKNITTKIYVQLIVHNSFKFEQLYFYSNQGRDKKKKVNLIGPLTLVSCEILNGNNPAFHSNLGAWVNSQQASTLSPSVLGCTGLFLLHLCCMGWL